ncbi:HCNGP-like protein [Ditylenchus destructor]|nr:HCNGP-like protein [Ditylenchus destructor]
MNNLVAYGSDSDEEHSDSSPTTEMENGEVRRSTLSVPSNATLKVTHSQSSLLAYGERDVVDDFDKDFERQADSSADASTSAMEEPQPPRRVSEMDHSPDDRSPNESDIDMVVEEALNALKPFLGENGREPDTPRSSAAESPGGVEEIVRPQKIVEMPPSPPGECDPEIQQRFNAYFEKKAAGMKMNEAIKKHKSFKNPAIYEFLVNKFNIDEKGTNFSKEIYDPHCFNESEYYDALAEHQRKLQEKMNNTEARKSTSTQSAVSAAADSKQRKATRFANQ